MQGASQAWVVACGTSDVAFELAVHLRTQSLDRLRRWNIFNEEFVSERGEERAGVGDGRECGGIRAGHEMHGVVHGVDPAAASELANDRSGGFKARESDHDCGVESSIRQGKDVASLPTAEVAHSALSGEILRTIEEGLVRVNADDSTTKRCGEFDRGATLSTRDIEDTGITLQPGANEQVSRSPGQAAEGVEAFEEQGQDGCECHRRVDRVKDLSGDCATTRSERGG